MITPSITLLVGIADTVLLVIFSVVAFIKHQLSLFIFGAGVSAGSSMTLGLAGLLSANEIKDHPTDYSAELVRQAQDYRPILFITSLVIMLIAAIIIYVVEKPR